MYWLLNENKQKEVRLLIDNLVVTLSKIENKVPHNDQIFPFQGRKVVKHAEAIISTLTNEGEIICDPFIGSGTFAYASAFNNRVIYANEYEPYTCRMAFAPFSLPPKQLLQDTFDQYIKKIKPKIDYYYRTKCTCGEILPLDSLFFDREPLAYHNVNQHERLGTDGRNITFRGKDYKCPSCGATEKYFDDFDQKVLEELEDNVLFDATMIENSRINLSKKFLIYRNLFPKRSRVVTSYIWESLQLLEIEQSCKVFIENVLLSIIPLAKYKDYRSKSQDLHCPPVKLRETNILNKLTKQFKKRVNTLYGYNLNNYQNIHIRSQDYRDFLSDIKGESINLLVTDPPWNDGNAYFERAQLYHPWLNYDLKNDQARLTKEVIVSDSPSRPDKHDKEQWWSDMDSLFHHAYRVLNLHSFFVLYFRPVPAREWIENFNKLKLLARQNGFEPLLSIDLTNNDPAMRIQQSAHYAFSSDLILTFLKLKEDERRIYINGEDIDNIAFQVAVNIQDQLAGAFTRKQWDIAMHIKTKEMDLLELHLPKKKFILDTCFDRVCEAIGLDQYLPKPLTPYSDEIYNTPYIERVSLYIPYVIEELLQHSDQFTFDQFLLKVAEFVENGTRGIIKDILEDGENSIHSLLNMYAEPLEGGKYFTKRPTPAIPSSIANLLSLDPYEFEAFVAHLLKLEGYKNVVVSGRSGDRGVDVRCNDKNGDLIIVQCKRYTKSNVGSTPIQRLHSFAITRGAQRMICITTTDFTPDGYDEASKTNVETINRSELECLVHKHKLFIKKNIKKGS